MDATRSSLLIRRSRRSRLIATPRERIERTAYELFSRHGVRAVGVDTLSARAGVAKMTLYKHYPCKDELALAFLRRREELWTRAWLQGEVERSNGTAGAKLLAIFEVFDTWFRRPDFEACAFVRVLLEHHALGHPLRRAAVRHLGNIRTFIKQLAAEAGVIEVTAKESNGVVVLSVRDNGPGYRPDMDAGVGLTNTRERLATLFGDAGQLEIVAAEGGGTIATVRFPVRKKDDEQNSSDHSRR